MSAPTKEQPDELLRNEAFEAWINTSKGYGLAFARECWNAAWKEATEASCKN